MNALRHAKRQTFGRWLSCGGEGLLGRSGSPGTSLRKIYLVPGPHLALCFPGMYFKKQVMLDVVTHGLNPSTVEAEASVDFCDLQESLLFLHGEFQTRQNSNVRPCLKEQTEILEE